MGRTFLNITSEIGKLKAVLLHRPGKEIENLVPEYLERLLFDDIPYLKIAQQEHDGFAKVLEENGAHVYYIEKLVEEVLGDDKLRADFIKAFLEESDIQSENIKNVLLDYLSSLSISELVSTLISGIRKKNLPEILQQKIPNTTDDKYMFYIDPIPNLYFTRDIGAAIGTGLTINKMKTKARKRETMFLRLIYDNHPIFKNTDTPVWYSREMPYSIEGGDELVLSSKAIAIGCSERTSIDAIRIVAKNVFKYGGFNKVLIFDIPKCRAFMHLDTVFTMVDVNKFTIHPGIEGPLNIYIVTPDGKGDIKIKSQTDTLEHILEHELDLDSVDLIRCGGGDPIVAAREQWNDGSNTLAIAPGRVITYERNYVSNELLSKHGIKVLTIASSELSRGRGGPRCMSMPLIRENV